MSVNQRGQVRPRHYESKYKRLKKDLETDKSDVNTIQHHYITHPITNKDENIHVHQALINTNFEITNDFIRDTDIDRNASEEIDDYKDTNAQDELFDKREVNAPEEIVNNNVQEDIMDERTTDTLEDIVDDTNSEKNVQLDELINILEMEHKWVNENEDFDEEEEDETEEDSDINEDDPIQPGHFLSIKTSVLLIWLLAIVHSYTSQMLADTLAVIRLHMINGYPALKSLYSFKRFFKNLKSPLVKHYYCSYCFTRTVDGQLKCGNQHCLKDISSHNSNDYFIELPIISQLTAFYSREEIRNGLKHRFERVKTNESNIEDVYDCDIYKQMSKDGGPLSSDKPNNISFIFNTDGIPIFKSSKTSCWPIFMMVNELPYRMRKSRENMLMCGLWFGHEKPRMNMFCQPLHKSLVELDKGINLQLKDGNNITVQGYLYSVSCDIPARSCVMNINQHNGESCCTKCLQTGINHRTPTGGNIRIFPYKKEMPTGPKRDAQLMVYDAQKVVASKQSHINGIKGPSFLMFTPMYDPCENICIDIMHLLYLGIVRMMMKLWFGVAQRLEPFSLYQYLDIVDARIISIKPSHLISRMPRSISEHIKFWKASELRSWFFYYSLPCVADIMPPKYLYHYCTLLEGIYLLNQSSISDDDIVKSEGLINYFVFMFPSLYGAKYVTINMHSLLHLPDIVRKIGPLWSTSCFAFESANGDLLKMFHGTQYIDIQIINAVHVFQMMPLLSSEILETSMAYPLVCSLMKKKKERCIGFFTYGKYFIKELDNEEQQLITTITNVPYSKICFYRRAILRGIMYHSLAYSRAKTRISYTVKYRNKESRVKFGYVCWFGELHKLNDEKVLIACISVLKRKTIDVFGQHHQGIEGDRHIKSNFMNIGLPYIHYVDKTEKKCIIPVHDILDLCLCIKFDGLSVVCEEPNHHEINL